MTYPVKKLGFLKALAAAQKEGCQIAISIHLLKINENKTTSPTILFRG